MKNLSLKLSRTTLALIIFACVFGNLFPFLNVDLGFVILTPVRSVLFLASVYSLFIWCVRFKEKKATFFLKNDWKEWAVFCFVLIWFISSAIWILFTESNPYAPTEAVALLSLCLLCFCFFTLVNSSKDVSFLLKLCVLCGVVLSILAFAELVFGSFVPNTKFYFPLEKKIEMKKTMFAPTTVFHNPNDFAAFMLLCLSIVCFWIVKAKTMRKFLSCLLISVVLILPVTFTDSTLYIIFLYILIFATLLILLLNRGKSWKKRLFHTSVIVLVFLFFVLFGTEAIRSFAARLNRNYYSIQIENFYENSQGSSTDDPVTNDPAPNDPFQGEAPPEIDYSHIENPDTIGSQILANQNNYGTIHIRLWLLRAGWDFFLDSPILGCGPESFRVNMSQNQVYLKETRGNTNPHFFYMELLSQYGIVLLTIYMIIILYIVIRSFILTKKELRSGLLSKGTLSMFLIGAFSAVVIMPSSVIRCTPLWLFFVLAVCVSCKEYISQKI